MATESVNKFGRNTDVQATKEDVWQQGGLWVAPTAARVHQIVSSSTDDDGDPTSNTGMQTCVIEGLDANGNEISETVTLDGTTNVPTTLSYTMINRMYGALYGSGKTNAGVIKATADSDSTVTCSIAATDGQSTMAIYQVPAGKYGWIHQYGGSILSATGNRTAEIRLEQMINGSGGWRLLHVVGLNTGGQVHTIHMFSKSVRVEPLEVIKISAIASAAVDVFGAFDMTITSTDNAPD